EHDARGALAGVARLGHRRGPRTGAGDRVARVADRATRRGGDVAEWEGAPRRTRSAPPDLLALAQRANDLAAEGRQIVGVARRDQIAVDDDLGVLPVAAGGHEVVLDREERRRLAAFEDPRRDEHPARVADGGDDFPLL